MGPRRLLLPAAALLLLAGPALRPAAPPPRELMRRVRAAVAASQPFRVEFTQQVYVDGELEMEESGFILFAGRERARWEYLHPEPKVFLLEKDRYQFYDREANQLTRGRLGEAGERLAWELLLAERPGDTVAWDAGRRAIRLRLPGGADNGAGQELLVIVGPDSLPERLEQTAEGGITTVTLLRGYRRRVALDAGAFALDLPADAEIVEEPLP